jgi:hypothetical protein
LQYSNFYCKLALTNATARASIVYEKSGIIKNYKDSLPRVLKYFQGAIQEHYPYFFIFLEAAIASHRGELPTVIPPHLSEWKKDVKVFEQYIMVL